MNDIFHISKLLIKKRLKVLTPTDELQLKKFNNIYSFLKDVKIQELVDKIDNYSKINKEKAWESIEKKSQSRKEKPVFIRFKKNLYKYAAAAVVVGILTIAYLFKDNVINLPVETIPAIVNTNIIEPGTDKAILTLEDGSIITLDKGNSYQTPNANSNGKEIVYENANQNSKELVYNYLTIPRGGQFFIKLADGTQVWLNSDSKLKYPVVFNEGENRQVELVYGEAYFDVSPSTKHKGAKFKVLNKAQEIEVIGTQFNIKAYKDETNIYTTLVEGKVAVSFDGRKQNLLPSEQSNFNLNTNDLVIVNVDVYNEISWKEGVFSFERKPLKDIMKVLSRWYDMDVVFENKDLEAVKFVGVLDKQQKINDILETIKKFKIIESYAIKNKTIILK